MRLKHLLCLLLALPLTLTSCEEIVSNLLPPSLTLTSEDLQTFNAQGGAGTISYTLTNASNSIKLSVSCEADWIENITVSSSDIKFNVAANEGSVRNTQIVVTYGDLSFEVTIVQESANDTGDNTNEPSITLSSEATMLFKTTGGNGKISYKLKNPVEGVNVTATCSANWVSDIKVGDDITFKVAANSGKERTARIAVTYGSYGGFEVTIKQNGELSFDNYRFETEFSIAIRVSSEELDIPENQFYIRFGDESERYVLDILIEGESDVLMPGKYTAEDGTFIAALLYYNDDEYEFIDGKVVVGGSVESGYEFDIVLLDTNKDPHHYTYKGDIQGASSIAPTEDTYFEAKKLEGEYYGDGNFYFTLSDNGINTDGDIIRQNSSYYFVNLYAENVITHGGSYATIPSGTYTFDANDTFEGNTFSNDGSFYVISNDNSYEAFSYQDGTLEVTSSGMTLTVTINGYEHTVKYHGKPIVSDLSSGGGTQPDDTILTKDRECDFSHHNLQAYFMGDAREVGLMYWQLLIEPDNGIGDFVSIHILSNEDDTTSFVGDYKFRNNDEPYTALPGYLSGEMKYCTWFFDSKNGTYINSYAAIKSGDVNITDNGDGTITVGICMYDNMGNKITGSWSGTPYITDISNSSMQAGVVECSVANRATLQHTEYKRGSAILDVPKKSIAGGKRLNELYSNSIW